MEKRMDSSNQISEKTQIPLLEEKSSSSPMLLQEQRLFRRVIWLTLFLGITAGIGLTLFGELCYILAGYVPHAFYPTSPIIYKLLGPLMMASMGFFFIILGKWQQLRRQHPLLQPGRFDLLDNYPTGSSNLSFGLFFVLCGGFGVLAVCLDPDTFWGSLILFLWVIGGIMSLVATWLIPFLKKRRRVRQ